MPSAKKSSLLFLSVILFTSFVLFSYLVAKEVFTRIDFDTTVRLQNHISGHFDLPFSILTMFGSVEITSLVWLIILGYSFIKKHFLTFFALGLFWAGLSVEVFGKIFLFHPAPPFYFYRGEGLVFPSGYIHTNYSYPSGHIYRTAFIITFFVTSLYLKKATGRRTVAILALVAFLGTMFISRIYLGEHWLSDTIGGMLLGSALGIIPALFTTSKNRQAG